MTERDPVPGDAPVGDPAPAGPPAAPEQAPPATAARAWPEPPPGRHRGRFAQWRGHRPFLGGVLMTLGGAEVLVTEKASFEVVIHIGMQGLSGYLIPAVLVLCGLLTIFNPSQRMFYSVLGVLLSLGTWVTSNLGGFFIGLILGVAGSCLAFGWVPDQEPRARRTRRSRRRAAAAGTGPAGP